MSAISKLIATAVDAPAFFNKDSKVGATVTIEVTATDIRQTRDPKDNSPQWWDDESPMQQLVIIGNNVTDGKPVSIYVKWWGEQRKRFAKAILDAGVAEPEVGDTLKVTYTGEGEQPKNRALSKPKLYDYVYTVRGASAGESSE